MINTIFATQTYFQQLLSSPIAQAIFVGLVVAAVVAVAVVAVATAITISLPAATVVAIAAIAGIVAAGINYGMSGRDEPPTDPSITCVEPPEEEPPKPQESKCRLTIRFDPATGDAPDRLRLASVVDGQSDLELPNFIDRPDEGSFESDFGNIYGAWLARHNNADASSPKVFEVFFVKPEPGESVTKRIEKIVRRESESRNIKQQFFGIVSEKSIYSK